MQKKIVDFHDIGTLRLETMDERLAFVAIIKMGVSYFFFTFLLRQLITTHTQNYKFINNYHIGGPELRLSFFYYINLDTQKKIILLMVINWKHCVI